MRRKGDTDSRLCGKFPNSLNPTDHSHHSPASLFNPASWETGGPCDISSLGHLETAIFCLLPNVFSWTNTMFAHPYHGSTLGNLTQRRSCSPLSALRTLIFLNLPSAVWMNAGLLLLPVPCLLDNSSQILNVSGTGDMKPSVFTI